MEWITCLRSTIDYMEDHLMDDLCMEDIAQHVHVSSVYLQKGFQLITGYALSEYLRNRRLFKAALELQLPGRRVTDVALDYGYETPESFAKAFSRFHGIAPSEVKKHPERIRPFHPLQLNIIIKGGDNMNHTVERKTAFQLIGFCREFSFQTSFGEIPGFWDEVFETYTRPLMEGAQPETPIQEAVCKHRIGEFGLCIDDIGKEGKFRYLIGGRYQGGPVPEGLTVYNVSELDWAVFKCTGPLPGALQSTNTQIFSEWLPGNPDYELDGHLNVEWYSPMGMTDDPDYQSAIWIPVKKK